jgi:hypothetical protein
MARTKQAFRNASDFTPRLIEPEAAPKQAPVPKKNKAGGRKREPAWVKYWLNKKHSRLVGFDMKYAAIHVLIPAVFMGVTWRKMVAEQQALGMQGKFKTKPKQDLFAEYVQWCTRYSDRLRSLEESGKEPIISRRSRRSGR